VPDNDFDETALNKNYFKLKITKKTSKIRAATQVSKVLINKNEI
jgi:hypothetical protein